MNWMINGDQGHRIRRTRSTLIVTALALLACGGPTPQPETVEDLPQTGVGLAATPATPPDAAVPPPPPPPPPPPDPNDPRSPETIRRVIYGNHQNIVNCANTNANRAQPIVGKMLVSIRVEADGKVGAVELVNKETDEPDFLVCLRREVRALEFPPAEKRLTVRYPFNFKGH